MPCSARASACPTLHTRRWRATPSRLQPCTTCGLVQRQSAAQHGKAAAMHAFCTLHMLRFTGMLRAATSVRMRLPGQLRRSLLQAPVGGEEASAVLETVGTRPQHAFATRNHLELGAALDLLDFEAAAVTSGSKFVYLRCATPGLSSPRRPCWSHVPSWQAILPGCTAALPEHCGLLHTAAGRQPSHVWQGLWGRRWLHIPSATRDTRLLPCPLAPAFL